jgi:hypothetical protein
VTARCARTRTLLAAAATAWLAAAPHPAGAVEPPTEIPVGPNSLGPCPGGTAIAPTQVLQGQFPASLGGATVMLPVEVPPGTTQFRVRYCWEGGGSTVDLGLWSAREGAEPWGVAQFRGWGGSSHPDVAVSARGFSSEAAYLADPKGYVAGHTTRGFLPGPIDAGVWAVELGVAVVSETDADGHADWRVEVELSSDPAFAAPPYEPEPYDETPADPEPGWYAGDLHVHAEHSALGDATMTETFDYAFRPLEEGGAGLDFVTLSDYVTSSAWGEIGRYQALHPGKLVIRSTEIITYRGHANQHASLRYVDHRTGPVYELEPDGGLVPLRPARPPAELFAEVRDAGGVVQLNHVTTCPSTTAFCRRTCRGCPWDYDDAETGFERVDAIEVHNGSRFAYDLFTAAAIAFWEEALAAGHRIAAVGSSDSHHAGVANDATQSPIGEATTVVYAEELSEAGILAGLRAGHTYVKLFGNDGPDLRFEAFGDEGGSGIPGDALADRSATLRASVLGLAAGEPPHRLELVRNGTAVEAVEVATPGGTHDFRAETPGRYRLELEREGVIQALTSPIYLPEAPAAGPALAALATIAALSTRPRGHARSRRHPGAAG